MSDDSYGPEHFRRDQALIANSHAAREVASLLSMHIGASGGGSLYDIERDWTRYYADEMRSILNKIVFVSDPTSLPTEL